MAVEFLPQFEEEIAFNLALHDIESIFKQHGLSCIKFGLPQPNVIVSPRLNFNQQEDMIEAERKIAT